MSNDQARSALAKVKKHNKHGGVQAAEAERRLELLCVHGNLREILAVVARDELVTNLDVWRYPDGGTTALINCKTCRRHWRLPMARLRERVDARHGLEKVAISELAVEASGLLPGGAYFDQSAVRFDWVVNRAS